MGGDVLYTAYTPNAQSIGANVDSLSNSGPPNRSDGMDKVHRVQS